ncbi:MAG: SDR family NAD(P)-dependent oxidoreductase [Rhodospirillaceae bacterium]|nr:SDR family NAD(P)-dependent oxidoreductase [Rhodospirillaceae bacterium]MBT4220404.1 SDR family NAD(P)-dependent oxidoreductase [Rhodospirillaceae bacterium]MBT4463928.1 SDR family NAD(P)-dependent oxidoreductase [Rhodospirillaceae bacterium]MBT5308839.1 SDR family NAD(P)-dependent oxidoreductase [Rhodospirillaceae bacterium]MBT7355133.1 SDR family NAD(P)-dependent oxidoreductase [Rhodospirillaceae bacterium]
MTDPRSILITGASSGIGAALALDYAAPGVFLALTGRNADRLEAVARACREAGAMVTAETVDAADMQTMADWIDQIDEVQPLDLVIANAGISGGGKMDDVTTRDIFSVNMAGVLNTVLPVLPRMQKRGQGQIALMSSLAGFFGMSSAPAYSASKVMVKAWGEALRGRLSGDGIGVSIICPGFVKSRITDENKFNMPLLMEADKAARIIRKKLVRNPAVIAFPWPLALAIRIMNVLPSGLRIRLLNRLPNKG